MSVAALGMLAAGLAANHTREIRRGEWAGLMPNVVLLATERSLGGSSPRAVRWELVRRLDSGRLSSRSRAQLALAAVGELGDDRCEGNADWAMGVLDTIGDQAVALLESALRSPDWQRRQLAATLLRWRWHRQWYDPKDGVRGPPYWPPDELFRVSVEGLRDDALPYDARSQRYTYIANGRSGFGFLIEAGTRSEPFLRKAIDSGDPQQRFLAAVIACWIGSRELAPAAASILVQHLAHNSTAGDARVAARALYRLGPEAIPYLAGVVYSSDRQQADSAALVLIDLAWPDAPMSVRRPLNGVTGVVEDPATDLPVWIGLAGVN